MIAYLVSSLGWSIGGLVFGYWLGKLSVEVEEVHDAVVDGETPRRRAAGIRKHRNRIFGFFLVVLAAASVVSTLQANANLARVTQCQSNANQQLRDAIQARQDAARDEAQAQRDLLTARGDPGAVGRYLAALDRLEAARKANPLPERVDCR